MMIAPLPFEHRFLDDCLLRAAADQDLWPRAWPPYFSLIGFMGISWGFLDVPDFFSLFP